MGEIRLMRPEPKPHHIPGIYNYCDRWCERCSFTSRCLNYEMSEAAFDSEESRDPENKLFWERLGEVFAMTKQMLYEAAEEQGIDLDDAQNDPEVEEMMERHDRIQEATRELPVSKSAMRYTESVNAWFESAGEEFKDKGQELERRLEAGLPESDVEEEASSLSDAVDVVRFYQYPIYVKLQRALFGKETEPEEDWDGPLDSDGSAKVALLAIDRSIAAWGSLWKTFPDEEDAILALLVQLERLRKAIEALFPDARAFVRPGFDE